MSKRIGSRQRLPRDPNARLDKIEAQTTQSNSDVEMLVRLARARHRAGGYVDPASLVMPATIETASNSMAIEDLLREGRMRNAQSPHDVWAAKPEMMTPPEPAAQPVALPGKPETPSQDTPPAPLDRKAAFEAFAKSARGALQTVDVLNFNEAWARSLANGTLFVAPPLAPAKDLVFDAPPRFTRGIDHDPYA